jgi:pyruvate/2-oxoglutarate dehydrogenase complex dihydrolipoamide acyltransferase (E2) component
MASARLHVAFAGAVVAALRDVPEVNAEIDGGEIVFKNYYDLMAVSAPSGSCGDPRRDRKAS